MHREEESSELLCKTDDFGSFIDTALSASIFFCIAISHPASRNPAPNSNFRGSRIRASDVSSCPQKSGG
jgi:hypothetical protein